MRNQDVPNRLDLLDLAYLKDCEPTVEANSGSRSVLRYCGDGIARDGAIEHSAYRDTVDVCEFDAEADDATRMYVPQELE